MKQRTKSLSAAGALALLIGLLAGCTTGPTPYQPARGEHGYVTEDLGEDLLRVSFRGNTETSEDQVEARLFRRMVDLASERGAGRFIVIDSETECVTTLQSSPTTTCVYRQSADATFPYHFGVYEVDSLWHASPKREYQAVATMRLSASDQCGAILNCFVTAEALAMLPDSAD